MLQEQKVNPAKDTSYPGSSLGKRLPSDIKLMHVPGMLHASISNFIAMMVSLKAVEGENDLWKCCGRERVN